jgi:hypothetical protein
VDGLSGTKVSLPSASVSFLHTDRKADIGTIVGVAHRQKVALIGLERVLALPGQPKGVTFRKW